MTKYKYQLCACFGGLLLAIFVAGRWPRLALLKERLQLHVVPSAVLSVNTTGEILRRLDLLQVVPNEYTVYKQSPVTAWNIRQRLFQRKSQIGIQLYGTAAISPDHLPSSTIVPDNELRRPEPLVSVVIDPADLDDPAKGIVANPQKRGKLWERPAFLSYFEQGALKFAGGIGLRMHGGKSRIEPMEKSFRAYFRDIYGEDQFPPGLIFDETAYPLRNIILHNDRRNDWFLVNPLAYDIARRIGVIAPQTKPVRFYLNGIFQGVYVVTEHLDDDYLRSHYGHDHFVFVRTKEDAGEDTIRSGDPKYYATFKKWASAKTPLTMHEVEQQVNLDNLVNWIISILFCGPTDANQGPLLLNLDDPDPRWFWINWDMDHSFQDLYKQAEHPWEIDTFSQLRRRDERGKIFLRLMANDDEFRTYFFRAFMDAMNHKLTQNFLDERFAYYEHIALTYGISEHDYLAILRQFFLYRKAVLRKQLHELFAVGPSYPCTVTLSQPHATIEIDGYANTPAGYVGWYFEGMTVRVHILPEPGYALSHWMLNDQEVSSDGNTLEIPVMAETRIEAVLTR